MLHISNIKLYISNMDLGGLNEQDKNFTHTHAGRICNLFRGPGPIWQH